MLCGGIQPDMILAWPAEPYFVEGVETPSIFPCCNNANYLELSEGAPDLPCLCQQKTKGCGSSLEGNFVKQMMRKYGCS